MGELFRKSALDTMATPEQLDKQVKIIRPASWVIGLMLTIGMLTFVLWSFTYHITSGVNMIGVVFTNNNVVQTRAQRECIVTDVLVSEGEHVDIGDIIAVVSYDEILDKIEEVEETLSMKESSSNEYKKMKKKQQELIDTYIASTIIKSNSSGYIQSIVSDGSALEKGDYIFSLMQDSGYNEVVAYVPMQTAKNLTLGMVAQISPLYAPREEYGYMKGVITSIGDTPVTEENIITKMGTISYVENILPTSSYVEVKIKLEPDTDSANQYHWSNKKGEQLSVELGTQCSIIVVTKEYRPIEILLD